MFPNEPSPLKLRKMERYVTQGVVIPYTHLTENERYVISHLIIHDLSIRKVASRLNRSANSGAQRQKARPHPHLPLT